MSGGRWDAKTEAAKASGLAWRPVGSLVVGAPIEHDDDVTEFVEDAEQIVDLTTLLENRML